MKAQIATIDLGFVKFDGLMMPDGEYAIAIPQVATLIQFNPNTASRDFKRLMGEGFNSSKQSIEGTKAQVNIINLDNFIDLLYALAKDENVIADTIIKSFLKEPLQRRFDIAFGKKVSESEYNKQLAFRYKRLLSRRLWTDVLQERHLQCFGVKPTSEQFKHWTVRANQVLFGKRHFNCDRDTMEQEEQRIIEAFEFMAVRRAKQNPNVNPDKLLELALDTF
jgi:hypothetical protein